MKALIKASEKLEVVDEKFTRFLHSRKQLKNTKEYNIWISVFPQSDVAGYSDPTTLLKVFMYHHSL